MKNKEKNGRGRVFALDIVGDIGIESEELMMMTMRCRCSGSGEWQC